MRHSNQAAWGRIATVVHPEFGYVVARYTSQSGDAGQGLAEVVLNVGGHREQKTPRRRFYEGYSRQEDENRDKKGGQRIPTRPAPEPCHGRRDDNGCAAESVGEDVEVNAMHVLVPVGVSVAVAMPMCVSMCVCVCMRAIVGMAMLHIGMVVAVAMGMAKVMTLFFARVATAAMRMAAVGVSVVMPMVVMMVPKGKHAHQVDEESESADDQQLRQPFRLMPLYDPLEGLKHDLDTY